MWRMPFLFSDMVFPIWWLAIFGLLLHNRTPMWKAWFISTAFVLAQAYIVGKTIGWNLGMYFIVFIGNIPSTVLTAFGYPRENVFSGNVLVWWVFPISMLLVLPTLVLYVINKNMPRVEMKTPNQAL